MRVILFLLLGLSVSPVFARNYFVNSLAGNDLNPGTRRTEPWKSLSPVHTTIFQAGDTISFESGSSWDSGLEIKQSGTEGKPIVFRAIGEGPKPVFSKPGNMSKAISILGKWIVVEGFLARDAHYAGIHLVKGADWNVVRNCEITNCGGGVIIHGRQNLITHNYAHDLTMIKNTAAAGKSAPGGDDDYGAVAYWVFNARNEISYNRAERCRASSYDYGADGGFFEVYANGDSTYVHHNYAEDCNGFLEIGGGKARGIVVAHNVSIDNGEWTFHLGGKFRADIQNFIIEYNSIVSRKGTRWDNVLGFGKGLPEPGMLIFRNNVVVAGGGNTETVAKSGDFVHENNTYFLLDGAQLGFKPGRGEQVNSGN